MQRIQKYIMFIALEEQGTKFSMHCTTVKASRLFLSRLILFLRFLSRNRVYLNLRSDSGFVLANAQILGSDLNKYTRLCVLLACLICSCYIMQASSCLVDQDAYSEFSTSLNAAQLLLSVDYFGAPARKKNKKNGLFFL
ncbi:hypothetical protein ABZP36_005012 [Zizania latifolia]